MGQWCDFLIPFCNGFAFFNLAGGNFCNEFALSALHLSPCLQVVPRSLFAQEQEKSDKDLEQKSEQVQALTAIQTSDNVTRFTA